jgi:hypothetical protein
MKEFLTNIGSVYWWVSVVVVGILINLASAYLKTRLDTSVSRASKWWRLKSNVQRAQRQKDIARLRGDSQEQLVIAISEIRHQIRAVGFLVFTLIFLVFAVLITVLPPNDLLWRPWGTAWVVWGVKIMKPILMTLSTIAMLVFMSEVFSGLYDRGLLKDARTLTDDQSAQHNESVQPTAGGGG